MPGPRILLVPTLTEIEWPIKALLEDWAEVASFDMPGVGDEPPVEQPSLETLQARTLAELDRLGWDRFVIVADEWGGFTASRVAAARREQVAGFAFGHACLSFRQEGDRAPVNAEVVAAFRGLADKDYRAYARALTQITQNAYDDETAERYMERVPQEQTLFYMPRLTEASTAESSEPFLRQLDRPLLLAKHEGCLAWTDEGYEDAVAAFPEATTVSIPQKPSVSPDFARALREFCEELDWGEEG
jgi:pimeloyl-ACP methyl ester carboxylesterase